VASADGAAVLEFVRRRSIERFDEFRKAGSSLRVSALQRRERIADFVLSCTAKATTKSVRGGEDGPDSRRVGEEDGDVVATRSADDDGHDHRAEGRCAGCRGGRG